MTLPKLLALQIIYQIKPLFFFLVVGSQNLLNLPVDIEGIKIKQGERNGKRETWRRQQDTVDLLDHTNHL